METELDSSFIASFNEQTFLISLAFLADITEYLNVLNKNLQGKDQNISHLVSHIIGFRNKLRLLRSHLINNNLVHFECCNELAIEIQEIGQQLNLKDHVPMLDKLVENFDARFSDFDAIKPELKLFNNPTTIDVEETDIKYQMELCELQADEFFKSRLETGVNLFKMFPNDKYPKLRDLGLKLISMFGSTYICERAFSDMKYIKSKYRNSMADKTLEEILRISSTKIDINIEVLVAAHINKQFSH